MDASASATVILGSLCFAPRLTILAGLPSQAKLQYTALRCTTHCRRRRSTTACCTRGRERPRGALRASGSAPPPPKSMSWDLRFLHRSCGKCRESFSSSQGCPKDRWVGAGRHGEIGDQHHTLAYNNYIVHPPHYPLTRPANALLVYTRRRAGVALRDDRSPLVLQPRLRPGVGVKFGKYSGHHGFDASAVGNGSRPRNPHADGGE